MILNLGWFVDAAVVPEVLLLCLHIIDGLLLGSVLQPWDGATDPFQQLMAERKHEEKTNNQHKMIRNTAMIKSEEVLTVHVHMMKRFACFELTSLASFS